MQSGHLPASPACPRGPWGPENEMFNGQEPPMIHQIWKAHLPDRPVSPLSPFLPGEPSYPGGPWMPCAPGWPSIPSPVSPRSPFSPRSPCGPSGPIAPGWPWIVFYWTWNVMNHIRDYYVLHVIWQTYLEVQAFRRNPSHLDDLAHLIINLKVIWAPLNC